MTAFASALILVAKAYLAVGLAFALLFATLLVARLDPAAKGGTVGFRVLIVPGATLFWPLLLGRLLRGRGVPVEHTAHKARAGWTPPKEQA